MNKFYPVKVKEIRKLTSDSIEILFDVTSDLISKFSFEAGQYITIKHNINGEQIRRSYSLCSNSNKNEVAVGVKKVENGKMSTFLTDELKVNDVLELMPPSGNFVLNNEKNIVAICAGSGITPLLSMMKSSDSNFTLIYGNKTENSTMFYEEIEVLNPNCYFVYSREKKEGSLEGRIDKDLLSSIENILDADAYFICGPGEMIDVVESYLLDKGVDKSKINFERFSASKKEAIVKKEDSLEIMSNMTVIMDGDEFEYVLSSKGESVLDSAMEAGADVPFSCKGGVCCTCKAKVLEGKVIMDENFSLSDEEVEEGFILSCMAHPVSENVIIDFDEM